MSETRTASRPFEVEPGHFVRADGERTDTFEGASKYVFKAAIFTNGRATDGDIIDLETLHVDGEMPFFAQHMADATTQLGSFTNGTVRQFSRASADGATREAVWDGVIQLGGTGALQAVRQDVAWRLSIGELKRFSGRWGNKVSGGTKRTPRADLPEGHWAGVGDGDDEVQQRGQFWLEAEAMEGSVVGLNADHGATARDLPPEVRDFYAAQAKAEELAEAKRKIEAGSPLELLSAALVNASRAGVSDSDIAKVIEDHEWNATMILAGVTERVAERADEEPSNLHNIARTLVEMQTQLDDLRLALSHEPERVDGEDPTHEPETADGGEPLDSEGLRAALSLDSRDTTQSDPADVLRRALNRAKGMPSDG